MSTLQDARTIVEILRTQVRGTFAISEAEAIRFVVNSLNVAEQRGYIDGVNRMGEIADKALAPTERVASHV